METITNQPRTLAQRLAGGRLSTPDALSLAAQLGNALRRLHDEGRVHGDLSPEAILLHGPDLELIRPNPGASETRSYAAPELLHNQSPSLRNDIYAFGAVMYEMLTGRRVYGPNALIMEMNSSQDAGIAEGAPPAALEGPGPVEVRPRREPIHRKSQRVREFRSVSRPRVEKDITVRQNELMKVLRAEVEQLELRLFAQLEQQEEATARMRREFAEELSRRQEAMSDEIHKLQDKVNANTAEIESCRSGLALTDDLVERVLETVEISQTVLLDPTDDQLMGDSGIAGIGVERRELTRQSAVALSHAS